MKRKLALSLLVLVVLVGALLNYTQSASSNSSATPFVTTFDVDRTDDGVDSVRSRSTYLRNSSRNTDIERL
jgi:hypothetical protein